MIFQIWPNFSSFSTILRFHPLLSDASRQKRSWIVAVRPRRMWRIPPPLAIGRRWMSAARCTSLAAC